MVVRVFAYHARARYGLPIAPSFNAWIASKNRGPDRRCVPSCTCLSYFDAAAISSSSSCGL